MACSKRTKNQNLKGKIAQIKLEQRRSARVKVMAITKATCQQFRNLLSEPDLRHQINYQDLL